MPGEENDISYQPKYLDKNVLNTPAVALGLAAKEVVRMGDLALENIRKSLPVWTTTTRKMWISSWSMNR